MTESATVAPRRSGLVSLLAWLGILSGLGATVMGVAMVSARLELASISTLGGGVMALVAAIGLKRRRNWARLSYIGVQVIGIVRILTLALAQSQARTAVFTGVLVYALINGLIIAYLCSPSVLEEFDAL